MFFNFIMPLNTYHNFTFLHFNKFNSKFKPYVDMNYLKYVVMAAFAFFTMLLCELTDDNDSKKDSPYVKFIN